MFKSNSLVSIYIGYLIHLIRAPVIATLLFHQLHPIYNMIYTHCSQIMQMSDCLFGTIMFCSTIIICYWINNTFYYICDTYGYLQKYKVDREKHQIPSRELIIKTIRAALISQFLVNPIFGFFLVIPLWLKTNPNMFHESYEINQVSFLFMIYLKFVFCDACNSWLFYIAHRALHHPYLYGRIHKKHHEYNGPISFGAEYAHIIERLFANIIPVLIGPLITGAHPLQFMIWMIWRLQEAYEVHSGYVFHGSFLHKLGLTNSDKTLFHDLHHTKNNGNFGQKYIDALFGTISKKRTTG